MTAFLNSQIHCYKLVVPAEIPIKAERVRMIVTNESRSNEYYYTFDPDRKRG